MGARRALVTGFEPYGGRGVNPSAEVVRRMDGLEIQGARVVGRVLPVSFAALRARVEALLEEVKPAVVVALGLWPGEPVIRLERIALNLADFEIPDNDGLMLRDDALDTLGVSARPATLPLRAIETALLQAGIPTRLSTTAGTFLCNATLYSFLSASGTRGPREDAAPACGFIHLPYLPEQVAGLLVDLRKERRFEQHQRADLASMSLATMMEAVRIALGVSLRHFHPADRTT
jgi:pyroglutamyl-peptidase